MERNLGEEKENSQNFIECRADAEVFDFNEVAAGISYHSQCKTIMHSSYNTISNSIEVDVGALQI